MIKATIIPFGLAMLLSASSSAQQPSASELVAMRLGELMALSIRCSWPTAPATAELERYIQKFRLGRIEADHLRSVMINSNGQMRYAMSMTQQHCEDPDNSAIAQTIDNVRATSPGAIVPRTALTTEMIVAQATDQARAAAEAAAAQAQFKRDRFQCEMLARNSVPLEPGRGSTIAGAFVNGIFNAVDADRQRGDIYSRCIQAYAPR